MTAMNPANAEAQITLPGLSLVGSVLGVSALLLVGWLVVAAIAGFASGVSVAGFSGISIVAGVSLATIVIMVPWKCRPILTWMTFWMGGTVARLLVTPALTFLLYSAVSVNATALTLSVALTYLAVVLTEALVVSRHVARVTSPHEDGHEGPTESGNKLANTAGRPARQDS